jgi:hypothetical protein
VLIRMHYRSIDLFVIEQASACVKIEFKVSVNCIGRECNKKFAKQAIRVLLKTFGGGSSARGSAIFDNRR